MRNDERFRSSLGLAKVHVERETAHALWMDEPCRVQVRVPLDLHGLDFFDDGHPGREGLSKMGSGFDEVRDQLPFRPGIKAGCEQTAFFGREPRHVPNDAFQDELDRAPPRDQPPDPQGVLVGNVEERREGHGPEPL